MRILLVGEYSRLHNTLKEALATLGHEVILVGSGDGFKNYPVDYSIEAKWSHKKLPNLSRQAVYKLLGFDFAKLEIAIRAYFLLNKLKGFDVVQLINERPIQTLAWAERYLLGKLAKNNKKLFVLSTGVDYLNVKFWFENKHEKSILHPYFNNPALEKEFRYILDYRSNSHKKIHDFVYEYCHGIIATDVDYMIPLRGNSKFLGMIPNPVNLSNLAFEEPKNNEPIVIFLGINEWSYYQKGIGYFEKALAIIKEKYADKVEILIVKNIPYSEYINLYNKSHILLDQLHGHDQGYNALEAMAKGKAVFTNASEEFEEYYHLSERVAVHSIPDVDYLIKELSFLIENPIEISAMGKRARAFIEKEHHHIKIAGKYLETWNAGTIS